MTAKLRFTSLFLIFLAFWASFTKNIRQVHASTVKPPKILILNIKNLAGNPEYTYLENSITSAIEKILRQRFVFRMEDKTKIMDTAEKNFFFREDFHTKSVAINLALLTRHNVVIGGGFTTQSKASQKEGSDTIIINIFIADLNKRKVIAQIQEQGPLGSEIFALIEKITARIAQEAKAVLPSKEQWRRHRLISKPDHQLILSGGICAFHSPGREKPILKDDIYLMPPDFNYWANISVDYRRMNLWRQDFVFWSKFMVSYGQGDFQVVLNEETASAYFIGADAFMGAGYKFIQAIAGRWQSYIMPMAGVGYQMIRLSYDYSQLKYPPFANDKALTLHNENRFAPAAMLNITVGMHLTDSLTLELQSSYQLSFIPQLSGSFIFNLGTAHIW